MPRRNHDEEPYELDSVDLEPGWQPDSRVDDLIAWTEPLLELFSVVDDVMSEDDWSQKLSVGMGRIRRQWEAVVKEFKKEL